MSLTKNRQTTTKIKPNTGMKLVRKSNHLIEAQYKFDIWETRIFTMILARIRREDTDFQLYRIYLQDIISEFGINNHRAYDHLREAINNLLSKKVYFNYETEYAERMTVHHLLQTGDYLVKVKDEDKRNLEEYFDLTIDPLMKPFLLELKKQFITYDMRNIMEFQSSYTVRIYEHLKQYESIGRRKMTIEYIRKTFDLGTKYPLFANFYQRIIAPAHRDINAHSDLMITEIDRIKESGKIISLIFHFYKKGVQIEEKHIQSIETVAEPLVEYIATNIPTIINVPTIQEKDEEIIPIAPEAIKETNPIEALFTEFETDVVKGFGVTPFVLLQLLQNYDADLIRKQIRITKRKRGASPTTNIAGFFVNAVKNDYNDPEEAKEAKKLEKQRQIEAQQRAAIQRKQLTEEYNELKKMVTSSINTTIRKLVANDPTLTPRAIEYAKAAILADKLLLNTFQQKGYHFDTIDLDTWRYENFLCDQIIEAMQKVEPKSFLYLSPLIAQLAELKAEIKSIPSQASPNPSKREG